MLKPVEIEWNAMSIRRSDWEVLYRTMLAQDVKSVVEFGSGVSTVLFDASGFKVRSMETLQEMVDRTRRKTPRVEFELWNGKELYKPLPKADMALIDAPHGGANREPSYKAVAESSIPLVACHDVGRPEDFQWVKKYFGDWTTVAENKESLPAGLLILRRPDRKLKFALVYNKDDHKLQDASYSWIYKGQLDALKRRLDDPILIHDNCSALDFDADVVMFYDIYSSHHIQIDGIEKHRALKIEYMGDPHQPETKGVYRQFNTPVHKLGREQRIQRAKARGVSHIVMPMKAAFFKYLGVHVGADAEKMLWYFPTAPCLEVDARPLQYRKQAVLANGATWDGGEHIYDFRRWAFEQPFVEFVEHYVKNNSAVHGRDYGRLLSGYAGALALHDYHPVPKYFEIPYAGCLTFAQHYDEYEELGFRDYETCVYVNRENFRQRVLDFLDNIDGYQTIADAGRQLVMENFTAAHFADFVYNKCAAALQTREATA